jgi:hypothetical protein
MSALGLIPLTLAITTPSHGSTIPSAPLTLAQFQKQRFALTLPVVPRAMVPSPPRSRDAGTVKPSNLPYSLLYALYRKNQGIANLKPLARPTRTQMEQALIMFGALGPARTFTTPNRLAIYWAFGNALTHPNDLVPASWVNFLFHMGQVHRPYHTVRGRFRFPPPLPIQVPQPNTWTIISYGAGPNYGKMPYLFGLWFIIHQNTVWILFTGEPKDLVASYARVPTSVISAPPRAEATAPNQVPAVLNREFPKLFPHLGLRPDSAVRLYRGSPRSLATWITHQSARLDSPVLGYSGIGPVSGTVFQGTWHKMRWEEFTFHIRPTPEPQASLWILSAKNGFVAVAAGANQNS